MQLTALEIEKLPKSMVAFMDQRPLAAGGVQNLGQNQVQVEPGGQIFTSIQAAINSIQNASEKNQYAIYVGPGTYNEAITLQPWVFIIGTGPTQSILTYNGSPNNDGSTATVIAVSNSGVAGMTVNSPYVSGAMTCASFLCNGVTNFNIANVVCNLQDTAANPANLLAIYNNMGLPDGPPCNVVVASSTIKITASNPGTFAIGIWAASNGTYQVFSSNIAVTGQYVAVGVAANPGANSNVTVDYSTVSGTQYCLEGSYQSTLVANQCQLTGPISPYVTVNN